MGFIIFENDIQHQQMADWFGGKDEVRSAGFVGTAGAEPDIGCFGESGTLQLSPGTLQLSPGKQDTENIKSKFQV